MLLYVLINIVIAVIGIVAVLYLLFRLFAWRQGDARFVIEARRRKPFELKQMTADTAVFETEVPFHNAGRQLGTIMDFYPRTLLPREQYDKCVVHSQLANKEAERDDNYWESVIYYPGKGSSHRPRQQERQHPRRFEDFPRHAHRFGIPGRVEKRMVHPQSPHYPEGFGSTARIGTALGGIWKWQN